MAWPGDGQAAAAAGGGHMRASHADRERAIDMLKAAFAEGGLTKDEFDAGVGRTLAARTYAELATVTSRVAVGAPAARPPGRPARRGVSNAARWGVSGFIAPAVLAAAFALGSLPGDGGYGAVATVVAFVYFVLWLSAGADMLWEWHCTSLPAARPCVRCAHTAASHRAPASCAIRRGPVRLSRCPCAGYVPPGLSPRAADLRVTTG